MTESTIESTTASSVDAAPAGNFVRAQRVRLTSHPTLDEAWLRERIVDDPSILGLGDLRLADEGRLRDGRLELLLRDGATGRRFAVLVRVGAAEEADLVRVLERWTVERTRCPAHEHFAVLVAEELPSRVLSAATTLGGSIPISALQASALRVGDHVSLYFAVVVDQLPHDTRLAAIGRIDGIGPNGANRPADSAGPSASTDPNGDTSNGNGRRHVEAEAGDEHTVVVESQTPFSAQPVDAAPTAPTGLIPARQPTISVTRAWDDPADARPPAESSNDRATAAATRSYRRAPSAGWRLFSAVTALSLLLCATAAIGWVRSYYVRDVATFADGRGQDHVIYSDHGQLDWIAPSGGSPSGGGGGGGNANLVRAFRSAEPREPRSTKIPYWLPVGITALLPLAWLIRHRVRSAEPY